jgi:hypothetical protein
MIKSLYGNKIDDKDNKALRISDRLTTENQTIQRELRILHRENKIVSIKFRNCFFNIKRNENSAYMTITSIQNLRNEFILVMEQTSY